MNWLLEVNKAIIIFVVVEIRHIVVADESN